MYQILFIDSGVGGLSVLAHTLKLCKQKYIYYADTLFAPYGDKPCTFLQNRLASIIRSLLQKYPIKVVVLACNTATITSIQWLRQMFPELIFVGTEPAINLANKQGFMKPALIATKQTILNLKQDASNQIILIPCIKLASIIEHYTLNPNIENQYKLFCELHLLKTKLQYTDCVILGCTHYSIIKNIISRVFQKTLIDGNNSVARRISTLNVAKNTKSNVKIVTSSQNLQELQKYKKILKQILANPINL